MSAVSVARVVGEQPRPRVLLHWSDGAADMRAAIAPHAPTIRDITSLGEVRQQDYDVLVTDHGGGAGSPSAHLFVVAFAEPRSGRYSVPTVDSWIFGDWSASINVRVGVLSETVVVPVSPEDELDDLIRDRLIPPVRERASHHVFTPVVARSVPEPTENAKSLGRFRPFLELPGGSVLAGAYDRSHMSEGWVLPKDVAEPAAWVISALRIWAVKHGQFPVVGGWWDQEQWQTRAEVDAGTKVSAARRRRAVAIAEADVEISIGTAELEQAQREAVTGLRCLLEGKGDGLAAAVAGALRSLGFEVRDLDAEDPPDEAGRAEDLSVQDPDAPDFDPLVEVKGYDQGAKAADLVKMGRHLARASARGRTVNALWWIVNHWRQRTPDDRELVLAAERAVIEEQAKDDPPLVIIDTRDLFRAVRDVEDGTRDAGELRASLRAARGRWNL